MTLPDKLNREAAALKRSRAEARRLAQPEHLPEFAEKLLRVKLHPNQVLWHTHMMEHDRVLMEAAVGHGKSTWLYPEVVQFICRCRIEQDWKKILFITSRTDLARDYTLRIERALELPEVVELYGKFRDKSNHKLRWGADEFDVMGQPSEMKEPIWRAAGLNAKIEGTRADWGIMDDPVERQSAISPAARNDARQWFESTFYARMNPGARITCIGSSWHPEDLYSIIRGTEMFECYQYPCFGKYEWGELLCPEMWTREELEKARETIGVTMFRLRYMMDNMAMVGGFFDEGWIEYIDHVPEGMELHQGWDPAVTKAEIADPKKADPDFTAGVTAGFDPLDGKLVLVDIVRKRIDRHHDMHIKNFWSKWQAKVVGVEDNAFQKLIRYAVQENAPEVPVIGVKHYAVDKKTRLLALQPYLQRGWKVLRTIPEEERWSMLAEYRTFPHGDHDDILDALEIAVAMMKKGGGMLLEGLDDLF